MADRPWADPNHESYRRSRKRGKHTCLGCGSACTYSAWGPWCHPCNVERLTRLNKSFAQLARSIGDEDSARNRGSGVTPMGTETPLFIPLRGEWYDKIERGEKASEYRAYGPRWNERTCRVGRSAVLSRGYGTKHRMQKIIRSFAVLDWVDAPPEARAIFPDAAFIAEIGLENPR